jgi:hypothetical protein
LKAERGHGDIAPAAGPGHLTLGE